MLNELVFVTSNENKVKEAQAILGFSVEIASLEIDEIQTLDVEDVARHKAQKAFEKVKKPLIVDDAGLYVEAWEGFPGSFVKFVQKTAGLDVINKWLDTENNRYVTVVSAIGYHDGNQVHTFRGEVHGEFVKPRGEHGWGFDPYFIPEGENQTWGELSQTRKNETSHRKQALEKLKAFLTENNYIKE
jgi:non-canonical purine NTP pyrophosphatase (RdgB/HAM1 family)